MSDTTAKPYFPALPDATAPRRPVASVDALRAHLAALRAVLHAAADGRACSCGACRHQVLVAAAAAGVTPRLLLAHLAGARGRGEQEAPVVSRPRSPLRAQVGASATFRSGGETLSLAEGLVKLAGWNEQT